MKITIINIDTRNRFKISGECIYVCSSGYITSLHIKSTFSDIFSFEQEAKQNEDGLKSIGLDVNDGVTSFRRYSDDLVEHFIIPEGFVFLLKSE